MAKKEKKPRNVKRRCKFVKPDGKQCETPALKDKDLCMFHDPEMEAKRELARKKGVSASKLIRLLPPETANIEVKHPDDVVKLVGDTIDQVRTGEIDPKIAQVVGTLAGILLDAIQVAHRYTLTEDIEKVRQLRVSLTSRHAAKSIEHTEGNEPGTGPVQDADWEHAVPGEVETGPESDPVFGGDAPRPLAEEVPQIPQEPDHSPLFTPER